MLGLQLCNGVVNYEGGIIITDLLFSFTVDMMRHLIDNEPDVELEVIL